MMKTFRLIFLLVALLLPTSVQASDLFLTMTAGSATAAANTNVTYTVQIINSGPETTNASLTIMPLNGQTFQSISKPGSWTCNSPSVNATGATVCTNTAFATTTKWFASQAVALNEFRYPTTPNGHWYKATTAGTTSSTEPTWNTGSGSTTSDGSVVWTEQGTDSFVLTVKIPTGTALWKWTNIFAQISFTPTTTSPPDPNMENDRADATTRVNG